MKEVRILIALICFLSITGNTWLYANTTNIQAKKPNPKLEKLINEAYMYYNESKDDECEKVIKNILKIDPKNREAFILRANIAMFAFNYTEMWANLDKIYKNDPSEPDVYSNFAMTHLNYIFLNDSTKRVMCRKTIRLASRMSEGYAALGMVAAVGGSYNEALSYFDIAYKKTWRDTLSRVLLDLPYANCLYSIGDTTGAIKRLDRIIPRMSGKDKYTCIFLRVKYKLEQKDSMVHNDLDTLNSYAANQVEVKLLNANFLNVTGKKDEACALAKEIRLTEGAETFDLSPYCEDLRPCLEKIDFKKLTYFVNSKEIIFEIPKLVFPFGIDLKWYTKPLKTGVQAESGNIQITRHALDSAVDIVFSFKSGAEVLLTDNITMWISQQTYLSALDKGFATVSIPGVGAVRLELTGHEQIAVLTDKYTEEYFDCLVLSDGETKVYFLNDPTNPLIVKLISEKTNLQLTKLE